MRQYGATSLKADVKLRRSISLNDELELLLQSVTGLVSAVQCSKISLNKCSGSMCAIQFCMCMSLFTNLLSNKDIIF